jgi:hypothetical protein
LKYSITKMRPLPDGSSGPSGPIGVFVNPSLLAALLSCLVAQLMKPLAHLHKDKLIDWSKAVSPGGMPSSHTAFVVGMTAAVGWFEGVLRGPGPACINCSS